MIPIDCTSEPAIPSGWKTTAAAGLLAGLSLATAPPAEAVAVFVGTSSISSSSSFDPESNYHTYTYLLSYTTSQGVFLNGLTVTIPLFDANAVTQVTTMPANWTNGGVVANTLTSLWANYNPLADPKAATYGAPASAFAGTSVPQYLQFSTTTAPPSSASNLTFRFTTQYRPGASAPFVTTFVTESDGSHTVTGDPLVPNSPGFPVPEPSGSALLLAAGSLFAARRRRD